MERNIFECDETEDLFDEIFAFDDEDSEPGEYDDDDTIFGRFDDKYFDCSDNEDTVTDPPGTLRCYCCNEIISGNDYYRDCEITLCYTCSHCLDCNTLMRKGGWRYNGHYYCYPCFQAKDDTKLLIHTHKYKPVPIFYGDSPRYFGVEVEIDGAGENTDNADKILTVANRDSEHVYIKTDSSLEEGMEIVSHPMTLDYHKSYHWEEVFSKAVNLGYRSHHTSTCGLHIHVSRDSLGRSIDEQEETISRILYFVESHWDELFRFSRRDKWSIYRWAGRYGYEQHGRDILEKSKKRELAHYSAVNLANKTTIEFRIFKGTLKYNTFIATLELVNAIIETAVNRTEDELHRLTWEEFAAGITEPELVTYLKERGLYISEENQGAEVP